jgi:hypothetical protein
MNKAHKEEWKKNWSVFFWGLFSEKKMTDGLLPTLARGATSSAIPAGFASANNFSLAPSAPFAVWTPPGSSEPTTQFGTVPGLTTNRPFSTPSNGTLLSMPTVNRTAAPSNELVRQKYTVRKWEKLYHERIGRGQIMFARRGTNHQHYTDVLTLITLPQMNEILRLGWRVAKDAGILDVGVARGSADAERRANMVRMVQDDLLDDIDRRRRELDEQAQKSKTYAGQLSRFLAMDETQWYAAEDNEKFLSERANEYLNYLSVTGISRMWNYMGVSINIEHKDQDWKMMNVGVQGPMDEMDNYWGEHVMQGLNAGMILSRVRSERTQEYTYFQFQPWIEHAGDASSRYQFFSKAPTSAELQYTDVAGYTAYGRHYQVGIIGGVVGGRVRARDSAYRLSGLADSPTSEFDAWKETDSSVKSTVKMLIGKDPYFTF